MCFSPLTVRRREKSSRGYETAPVPCGKCFQCINRKRKGWTFRLQQEQKVADNSSFWTLTYNEENVPYNEYGQPTCRYDDLEKFFRRLRTHIDRKHPDYKHKLKYYAVSEYGSETYRPHYHAIMYNLPPTLSKPDWDFIQESNAEAESVWKKGTVHIGQANGKSIAYVAGYVQHKIERAYKILNDDGSLSEDMREPERSFMSKKLGANFITPEMTKYLKGKLQPWVMIDGYKQSLPRYYKEKIFDKFERCQLQSMARKFYSQDDWTDEDYRMYHEGIKAGIYKNQKIIQQQNRSL